MTIELTDWEAEWLRTHLDGLLPQASDPAVVSNIFEKLGGYDAIDAELAEEETEEHKELIRKIALGIPL